MNQSTKEIVATLVNKQDLDTIFKNYLQSAINKLHQNEFSAYLGYERYSRNGFNSGDSRNGSYLRSSQIILYPHINAKLMLLNKL